MDRKEISVNGIPLGYLEQNPEASPTVFFFHGNSNAARMWKHQFADPQLNQYRMVAFDLPGHGPAAVQAQHPVQLFNVQAMGELMALAVETLHQGKPFAVVGLSLGTNVAAEMLPFGVAPRALVLVGASLMGQGITPQNIAGDQTVAAVMFTDQPPAPLVWQYLASACRDLQEHPDLFADHQTAHPLFRSSLAASAGRGQYSDEVALVLKSPGPILTVFGEEDRITPPELLVPWQERFWQRQIYRIPGAGHLVVLDQPKAFNDLLFKFLAGAFTNNFAG